MNELGTNSADPLCREILKQAHREAEELVQKARNEAQTLLDTSNLNTTRLRQERLSYAQAEATRRRSLIVSTIPLEKSKMESACREIILNKIKEEIQNQLSRTKVADVQNSLIYLIAEPISQMKGDAFTIQLSPQQAAEFGSSLIEAIRAKSGVKVTVLGNPSVKSGAVVESADGLQKWNNGLEARLERLWPEMRQRLALSTGLLQQRE